MSFLRRFRIGFRLSSCFGIILLLLIVITLIGISRMSVLDRVSAELSSQIYPKVNAAQHMGYLVLNVSRAARNLLILEDEAQMAVNKKSIDSDLVEFQKTINYLRQIETDEKGLQLIEATDAASKKYFAFTADVIALGLKHENIAGQRLLFSSRYQTQGDLLLLLKKVVVRYETEMQNASAEAHHTFTLSATILGASAGIAIILGIGAAIAITRSIVLPMEQDVQIARKVAAGEK